MSVWLLVGLLFLILCVEGYYKGALRTIFPLVGLFFAINLASPLSGWFQWFDGKWPVGQFPFWNRVLPVITSFILILLVFTIIGFVVHYLMTRRLQDKWDEYQIESFRKMDRKAGAGLGLVGACIYTVLFCTLIYQFGNFTLPFRSEGNDAWPLGGANAPVVVGSFNLNQARSDLESTPFLRLAAAYDKTPEIHYKTALALAKIYKNPLAEKNLRAYPGLFATGDEERFQDLNKDQEFKSLWSSGASLSEFLAHDGAREIINDEYNRLLLADPEELSQLNDFIDDLEDFLFESGESKRFGREKIVGRWKFARNISLRENRDRRVSFTVEEMYGLHDRLNAMNLIRITVMPDVDDNRILFFGPNPAAALKSMADEEIEDYRKAKEDGTWDEMMGDAAGTDDPFQQAYGGIPAGYQQRPGFGEQYGEEEEEEENSGPSNQEVQEFLQAMKFSEAQVRSFLGNSSTKHDAFILSAQRKRYRDEIRTISSEKMTEGTWMGKGIRYKLNLKNFEPELNAIAKELQKIIKLESLDWLPLCDQPKATILNGQLQLDCGDNIYIFVRY